MPMKFARSEPSRQEKSKNIGFCAANFASKFQSSKIKCVLLSSYILKALNGLFTNWKMNKRELTVCWPNTTFCRNGFCASKRIILKRKTFVLFFPGVKLSFSRELEDEQNWKRQNLRLRQGIRQEAEKDDNEDQEVQTHRFRWEERIWGWLECRKMAILPVCRRPSDF